MSSKKRRFRDSLSPLKVSAKTPSMIAASVLIPGEDTDKYLLTKFEDKGWWLPFGHVEGNESIQLAAKRIASEVSTHCSLHVFYS